MPPLLDVIDTEATHPLLGLTSKKPLLFHWDSDIEATFGVKGTEATSPPKFLTGTEAMLQAL